jgi:tetratricopeptide (TPR) repeat protein
VSRLVAVAFVFVSTTQAACTLFQPTVSRRMHGVTTEGRFVDEVAYATYAEAAVAEAKHDWKAAELGYGRVLSRDPASEDAAARLGAVRCARGDRAGADDAFRKSLTIDPEFAPAYFERARCELAANELGVAEVDARRALALAPMTLGSTRLLAEIVEKKGDIPEARRLRDGLALLASKHVDPPAPPLLAEVDRALASGELAEARRRATRARVSSGQLAVRAAALGLGALARVQASLVLAADPNDANARIALLAASDLANDPTSFAHALEDVPEVSQTPSTLARLLLADVLRRRGVSSVVPLPAASDDPLEKVMLERVSTARESGK